MGITIWGIVEAQLDFPGWKGRIIKGVLGYIGILLVPLVFLELQGSLQVDVWDQIEQHHQQIEPRLDPTLDSISDSLHTVGDFLRSVGHWLNRVT